MLEVIKSTDSIEARLSGSLTIFQADELFQSLKPLLFEAKDFTFDVSNVSEMDSSIIQIIVIVREFLTRKGKILSFINPSDVVQDLMKVMGFSDWLQVRTNNSGYSAGGETEL